MVETCEHCGKNIRKLHNKITVTVNNDVSKSDTTVVDFTLTPSNLCRKCSTKSIKNALLIIEKGDKYGES